MQRFAVLSELDDAHIAKYVDLYTDEQAKATYIITDPYEGRDLGVTIREHQFKNQQILEPEIWSILTQMLKALKYCHNDILRQGKKKVIHGEIRPMNIVVHEGAAKLQDFDIIRSTGLGALANTPSSIQLYMAPELLAGDEYDEKVDIWALGCVIYELITLRQPFKGDNQLPIITDIMESKKPPLPASCSWDLQGIVNWMLQREPLIRPSAVQLLKMVENRQTQPETQAQEAPVAYGQKPPKLTKPKSIPGCNQIEIMREKKKEPDIKDKPPQRAQKQRKTDQEFNYFTFYKGIVNVVDFNGEKYIRISDRQLKILQIRDLGILSLDCSEAPNLRTLSANTHCQKSSLEEIDVENCWKLGELAVANTNISYLDIRKLVELRKLFVCKTDIVSINISNNARLEELNASETQISQLDISHLLKLRVLTVNNTNIQQLDVSKNTKLEELDVNSTKISQLTINQLTKLRKLCAWNTGITQLDVSRNCKLEDLEINDTKVSQLNISQLTELRILYAWNTGISKLDISKNVNLQAISVRDTKISQLDVGQLKQLSELLISRTNIRKIDLSNNKQLIWVQASRNCNVQNCHRKVHIED